MFFDNDYRTVFGAASDPKVNMEPVGHFGGKTDAVDAAGNYAYVGQGQDLLILDITNPSSPVLMSMIMTKRLVGDIEISGNYACVANGDNGLSIIDISNPSSPTIKGYYAGSARYVSVSGNYAYVADLNGLMIIDISNSSSPVLKGS